MRDTARAAATAAITMVAVAACTALAAACSTAPEREFTPAGAAAGDRAGGAAGEAAAAPVPTVATTTVAPGLRVQVEWPAVPEPGQAAIIKAFGDVYTRQWRAVGTLGADTSYLDGVEEPASRDAYTWVNGFVGEGLSARGVARLYALRVASVSGPGAEVDGCVDESGVRVTDEKGTPVARQPDWTKPPKSTYFQAAGVRRGDDGTWRVKLLRHAAYPDERAKECVR
ncbi:hypothetical protein JOL79_12940 [Microbispora sp. RL4-1S]|uniref:Lipoprotein n=1 Tax=Microbispora oryzae TaxID=2806554 RepID=A0A940WPG3_9ACTN|nr:hypothetical protein [Microbispora oryzae]MBP2704721.1 hypothetical protein [Microbispora oryzae]